MSLALEMPTPPQQPPPRYLYSRAPRDFNAAAFGVQSDAWNTQQRTIDGIPVGPHTSAVWRNVIDDYNSMVRNVVNLFAEIILGSAEYSEWITLYHNTTAGIQRALLKVGNEVSGSATLLTTDMEYPGVMATIDEYWRGPVAVVPVSKFMWSAQIDSVERALRSSIRAIGPSAVLISHVDRSTGYRLSNEFLGWLDSRRPRPFVIIDGAQAAGNIYLSEECVKHVDFYATSGQKWLCGVPALGAVMAKPDWKMKDQAQSYTRDHGSGGTGNDLALRSLLFSFREFLSGGKERMKLIEEWNSHLAQFFINEWNRRRKDLGIPKDKLSPIEWVAGNKHAQTGIVTVRDIPSEYYQHFATLRSNGWEFCPIEQESWTGGGYTPHGAVRYAVEFRGEDLIVNEKRAFSLSDKTPFPGNENQTRCERFAFHFYHSQRDVSKLLETLLRRNLALKRNRR